jgi:NAD(P)-dependent dehydrogenase (short-subunit alcohol dehydrogenase family)
LSLVIAVTGTSSGFGRMAAAGLARAGHTVYACMHSLERSADEYHRAA